MSDEEHDEPAAATGLPLHLEGGLKVFSLVGDPNELSEKWIRWKRAFGLYIRAKCVELDRQKVALLLHSGGMELQDLVYTVSADPEILTYAQCTELRVHFTTKKNMPYETFVPQDGSK